jgi:hypothetical protein
VPDAQPFSSLIERPSQPGGRMKWLLGTYTSRYNRRHKLFGHLVSARYKAMFVDSSGNGYLKSDDDTGCIAERLHMGTKTQLSTCFYWSKRSSKS